MSQSEFLRRLSFLIGCDSNFLLILYYVCLCNFVAFIVFLFDAFVLIKMNEAYCNNSDI